MYKIIFFLVDHLARTKCRLVLSITHFMVFSYFSIKISFLQKKIKLSIKDYLLLIYVYDNISKDNNFKCPKPAFLARVLEWRGIGTDCPEIHLNARC